MTVHPRDILEALYAHPLRHNIRWDQLIDLWNSMGGDIERLDQQRLRLRLPDGSETWMHHAVGRGHGVLTADDVLRIRHLLQQAGINPHQPTAATAASRGDQAKRLVIRLDHRGADGYWLIGDSVEHTSLRAHGLWGRDQNLSHRHDRDVAGQRAPIDHDYLRSLCDALASADRVLLISHGKGQANVVDSLLDHLNRHHPELLKRISATEVIDDSALSEAQLLAHARVAFGNLPRRRPLTIPGQPIRDGLDRDSQATTG